MMLTIMFKHLPRVDLSSFPMLWGYPTHHPHKVKAVIPTYFLTGVVGIVS